MSVPNKIQTWQMVNPTDLKAGEAGVLERTEIDVPVLADGDVLVEIAGCGVCHTDLGYFYDGVPTVNPAPLTLGHEIAGIVVDGPAEWIGREVIVPAVMPCGECPICAAGRGNRCLAQKMPGNSVGIYGGFSSHIVVPYRDLCVVDQRDLPLAQPRPSGPGYLSDTVPLGARSRHRTRTRHPLGDGNERANAMAHRPEVAGLARLPPS